MCVERCFQARYLFRGERDDVDAIFLCKDSSWHNVVICARENVMWISRSCGDSCRP